MHRYLTQIKFRYLHDILFVELLSATAWPVCVWRVFSKPEQVAADPSVFVMMAPVPFVTMALIAQLYQAKLQAEQAIVAFLRAQERQHRPFSAALLRYFNVVGADPAGRMGPHLRHKANARFPRILDAIYDVALGTRKELTVTGDSFPTKDGVKLSDIMGTRLDLTQEQEEKYLAIEQRWNDMMRPHRVEAYPHDPKKKGPERGKSLSRRSGRGHRSVSSRHTTSTDDGPVPISITENTSIDEFLSNAEAAQRNFEAERGSAAIAVSASP